MRYKKPYSLMQWWVFLHNKAMKMTHCLKCKKPISGEWVTGWFDVTVNHRTYKICRSCDERQAEKKEWIPHTGPP